MVDRCPHCPAFVYATFRHGQLTDIVLRHLHKSACRGRIEPLDPDDWQPALLDGRTYDPDKLNRPAPDQGRNRTGLWDDHVPPRKEIRDRRRSNRPARRP